MKVQNEAALDVQSEVPLVSWTLGFSSLYCLRFSQLATEPLEEVAKKQHL